MGGSPNKNGCRYEKAVERLAEHVQSEFGSKMWSLITARTECKPIEPEQPTGTRARAASWEIDKYKMKYNQCLKTLEEYDLNKSKTFAVVYGQCITLT